MKADLPLLLPLAVIVTAGSLVATPAARVLPVIASPIDGRWHTTLTRASLMRTGEVGSEEAGLLSGAWTARFVNGHFHVHDERTGGGARGTFAVTGRLVRFVFAGGTGIDPGATATCEMSVYRDRLTFATTGGRPCMAWNAESWTREQ